VHHAGAALASADADDPLVESCREEFVGATTVRAFRATPLGIESHPEQLKRESAYGRLPIGSSLVLRAWLPGGRDIFCSAGQY